MNGAANDERLWWTMESDFDVAQFDKYAFGEKYLGPIAAVIGQTSITWQVALYPKGGAYEVRDHNMRVGIELVGGPVDKLHGVKYMVKVYKADGELEVKEAPGWPGDAATWDLEMTQDQDQLRPYLLSKEGVEYVRVRMELGIPKNSFEPLAMLPPFPMPHEDMAERLSRWSTSGDDMVQVVAGDDKRFSIYKGQLTEASDVFKAMLETAMKEGRANCIHMDDLCGEALDELITYITFGSTRPSRVSQHTLKLLDVAQRYLLPNLKAICERAVIEKMQSKMLPPNFLELLKAAETYELRVARNVGLCRLFNAFHQLSDADQDRFNSADFTAIRKRFMQLSNQSQFATKRYA